MEIQHRESENGGQFFVENERERVALLVYDKTADHVLVIEHTEVDKSLRGKNIGYELVHRTVEYARSNGFKISPVCPFAKKMIAKKPEWKEVLV